MYHPSAQADAPERVAAVRRTALLDTPPEEAFDRLTRMAARLLGAPIAFVSLVTGDRQFFKSATGLPEPWASRRDTPLGYSFCRHVVEARAALVVEDARRHALLRVSPAVRELGWVAYAGVPLVTRQGHVVGTLSVVDPMPRLWSERDVALLHDLAASAVAEIELRSLRAEGRREVPPATDVFDEAGIAMAIVSSDGRWVRVNGALCELLGVPAGALIGRPAEESTHPADRTADVEALRLLRAGECDTYTGEKRCIRRAGDHVWVLSTVTAVRDADRRLRHLVVGYQDVSDRRQADRELRESEERYRLAASAAGVVVRDWDLTSDRILWGEGFVTAAWWYERIHPEDRERVVARFQDAIVRGERSGEEEYRFRRDDGSWARILDRVSITTDPAGQPLRLLGTMTEVGSEATYRSLVDNLCEVVFRTDAAGRWELLNPAWEELTGFAPAESVGTPFLDYVHPDDRPGNAEEFQRLLAGEEMSSRSEVRYLTHEGGYRWVEVRARPTLDDHNAAVGISGTLTDISERRAAEEAHKMEAVGRLAGGIAHDFNNLLTGVLTYCDLVLQEVREGDPIRPDLEQIRHAGQRAAGLTRQLLAFSRRQVLQPRVLSLNTTVTELDGMLRRLVPPDVMLETELDPALWYVLADSGQIEQVLVNLVVNARDAMPQGGRITVSTANRHDKAAAYVTLVVADTGQGMDLETQARIFEPFFTTKEPGRGTGLGLSTVYGIVEQSGGHIAVETAPGRGARFTIHLPRYEGPSVPLNRSDRRTLPGGTETLLLVEDETAVRSSARRLLERYGYAVLEARHGADALRIVDEDEREVDLVLTDLAMPEMGGRELVEHLRSRRPAIRVLYMSGYTEKAITIDGLMPPRTGFVEKPFTAEQLLRRLRELLDED
ncbi:MAG: PAS domain S-box protein [Gemmatimonadales bacterium]|nr:PAS domain S-box protein [Gemmatimonadales bacterium]